MLHRMRNCYYRFRFFFFGAQENYLDAEWSRRHRCAHNPLNIHFRWRYFSVCSPNADFRTILIFKLGNKHDNRRRRQPKVIIIIASRGLSREKAGWYFFCPQKCTKFNSAHCRPPPYSSPHHELRNIRFTPLTT